MPKPELEVTYLDVGHGDSAIISAKCDNGEKEYMLIDTGHFDKNTIEKIKKIVGGKKIKYLVITHSHEDHIGEEIDKIKSKFDIENVVSNVKTKQQLINSLNDLLYKIKTIKLKKSGYIYEIFEYYRNETCDVYKYKPIEEIDKENSNVKNETVKHINEEQLNDESKKLDNQKIDEEIFYKKYKPEPVKHMTIEELNEELKDEEIESIENSEIDSEELEDMKNEYYFDKIDKSLSTEDKNWIYDTEYNLGKAKFRILNSKLDDNEAKDMCKNHLDWFINSCNDNKYCKTNLKNLKQEEKEELKRYLLDCFEYFYKLIDPENALMQDDDMSRENVRGLLLSFDLFGEKSKETMNELKKLKEMAEKVSKNLDEKSRKDFISQVTVGYMVASELDLEINKQKVELIKNELKKLDKKIKDYFNNSTSLVLQLSCVGRKFIFCGDCTTENQKKLRGNYRGELKSDFIKMPHHGLPCYCSSYFIKNDISPRFAVVSASREQYDSNYHTGGAAFLLGNEKVPYAITYNAGDISIGVYKNGHYIVTGTKNISPLVSTNLENQRKILDETSNHLKDETNDSNNGNENNLADKADNNAE